MYRKLIVTICLVAGAAVVGCQPESSTENAADNLEEAGEEMSSAISDVTEDARDMAENAGDDLKAAAEDATANAEGMAEDLGNQLEDACEKAKQEAGAADTDC